MTDSLRITDHLFNDAETLIERTEHACHVETSEQLIYDQITAELLPVSGAASAVLWAIDRDQTRTLSRSGIGFSPDSQGLLPEIARSVQDSALSAAPVAKWSGGRRLESTEQIGPRTIIGLTLQFDKPIDGSLSRPLCDLCETILGLASSVYLRRRFAVLSEATEAVSRRDQVLDELNSGTDLLESLACIAATIAREASLDRVSILRLAGTWPRMLVSSTQPRIDRRARQVRLLETLVAKVIRRSDRFRYVVGDPAASDQEFGDAALAAALDQYLNDSGSRELTIETIHDHQTDSSGGQCIAVIVLERFRIEDSSAVSGGTGFEHLRLPAFAAIRRALKRGQFTWATIASQFAAGGMRRRLLTIAAAVMMIGSALALVPAELKIPVEGRLLMAKHQRLYAPSSGTIVELKVDNGQAVSEGESLLRIRSAELDQQQQQLEGALATAKSKLAVVAAARTQSREDRRGSTTNTSASSEEQVLKTEVQGLQAQLELIREQQAELTLISPIEGRVDRWDLQQSLSGRPVVHGQYLIDIVSDVDGWVVELDIPDQEAQYVVDAQASQPCEVSFRLRSAPEKQFQATLQQLSAVTQFDSSGRPVVRGTLNIDKTDQELRFGATVIAEVHCGSRPLGFIWFRSVIQWARQSVWI